MKVFNKAGYAQHIRKKIPAYELMQEITFNSLIVEDTKNIDVNNILAIGSQVEEIQNIVRLFPKAKVLVVEPSEVMIEANKAACNGEVYKNVEYICDKFENVKLDQKFDLCICMLVFHFVEDINSFLTNMKASLASNASVILSAFTNEQMIYWKNFATARGSDLEDIKKTYYSQEDIMNVYSSEDVERLLKAHGFKHINKCLQVLSMVLYNIKVN